MHYRRDIDGLRAIAVLAVILFHFGFPAISGGFIGVDIFFVISGYLITSIIVNDLNKGCFSFGDFYLRRARRILPALYVVLIASAVISLFLFLPKDLISFGKSLASTVFFGSNIFFMSETDYFDSSALVKPLLHTWSLSVEEQFYFIFPFFLVLIRKFQSRHFFGIIFVCFVLNLILSEFARDLSQTKTFYLSPLRAWEFMLGSLLTHPLARDLGSMRVRHSAGIVGAVFLLFCLLFYTDLTPFPGFGALLPCMGTALIIYAGSGPVSIVSKILSLKPMVYIGLRSYSLYLWHWPVLVFSTYMASEPPGPILSMVLILLALLMSILTYKFVELPFRKKKLFPEDCKFVSTIVLISACLLVVAAGLTVSKGWPDRFKGIEILEQHKATAFGHCADIPVADFQNTKCKVGSADYSESFIVWGDSHAYAIAPAIDKASHEIRKSGFLSSNSGCPPLVNASGLDENCSVYNKYILENLNPGMTVFLSARWNYYVKKSKINHEGFPSLHLASEERSMDVLKNSLIDTIAAIRDKGARPVIIRPEVEFYKDVPEFFFLTGLGISVSRTELEENNRDVNAIIDFISSEHGVSSINVLDLLCDADACDSVVDKEPLYIDNDHLSSIGASKLSTLFIDFLR